MYRLEKKIIKIHTCAAFHITYIATVVSGYFVNAVPANKPAGIACNTWSVPVILLSMHNDPYNNPN